MLFGDNLAVYYNLLERRKRQIERELKDMPDGNVIDRGKGKYSYPSIMKNGKYRSISKHPELVRQYRIKEQLKKHLQDIQSDMELLKEMAERYKLLPLEALGAQHLQKVQGKSWDEIKAQQNTYRTDNRELIYKGVHYRSKSELLIAVMLTSYNLEFKYEVTLTYGYRKLYPDFAIKRPRDGKIIYLEHAGVIHKEDYVKSLHGRLDDYHEVGINLWDNLILTFDKEDGSIDMDYIDKIIRTYLL